MHRITYEPECYIFHGQPTIVVTVAIVVNLATLFVIITAGTYWQRNFQLTLMLVYIAILMYMIIYTYMTSLGMPKLYKNHMSSYI